MDNTLPPQETIAPKRPILANKKLVIAAIALIVATAIIVILLNIIRNSTTPASTNNPTSPPQATRPTLKASFVPPLFLVESAAQKPFEAKIILDKEIVATRIEIIVSLDSNQFENIMLKTNPLNTDWEIENGFYNKEINLATLTLIPKGKKVALASNPIALLMVTPKKGLSSQKPEIKFTTDSYVQLDNGNKYYLTGNPVTVIYPNIAPLVQ